MKCNFIKRNIKMLVVGDLFFSGKLLQKQIQSFTYLSKVILETSDKLNSIVSEFIFPALQVHYNLHLKKYQKTSM